MRGQHTNAILVPLCRVNSQGAVVALDILYDAPDETVRDDFTNPVLELFCRLKLDTLIVDVISGGS